MQHNALKDLCIELIGEWQLKQLVGELDKPAREGNDRAFAALAKLKGPKSVKIFYPLLKLTKITKKALKAVSALTSINMSVAVNRSVELFKSPQSGLDYSSVFTAIFKDKNGPKVLEESLKGQKIDSSIALLGVQRGQYRGA